MVREESPANQVHYEMRGAILAKANLLGLSANATSVQHMQRVHSELQFKEKQNDFVFLYISVRSQKAVNGQRFDN